MSTITKEFTKEQLIEFATAILDVEKAMEANDLSGREARASAAIAEIALASLEAEKGAEPVAKVETVGVCWYADNGVPRKPAVGTELFAAPPAPVAMKDHQIRDLVNELRDIAVEYYGTQQLRERIAKTVRAAMLHGAEPVTTAYKLPFEQWLSQQTGTIDVECGCVMTEVFFHWLRIAYEAGNSPVIPDGWVACSERMPEVGSKVIVFRPSAEESNDPPVKTATYKGGREYYHGFDCYCEPTHWMTLPAAPQQEVK